MTFNLKLTVRIVSTIAFLEGLAMLPSWMLAVSDGDARAAQGILLSAAALIILGVIGYSFTRRSKVKIKSRESYFVVLACWATAIIAGILPMYLSGEGYSLVDCIFESVSAWTTSTSYVIDIDVMPRALVLWHATASWLGGMGVILLALLLLTSLGVSGQKIAGAELPGPTLIKTTARMADTAKLTYGIYTAISLVEMVLLKLGGLPWFETVVNTMSSMSTCGLVDYHGIVDAHFTPYIKVVLGVFSIIAAMNFVLFINLFHRQHREELMDYEAKVFLLTIGVSAVAIAIVLKIHFPDKSIFNAIVDGFAGVVSYSCTTGFPLERIYRWPSLCKAILLVLMIVGGCSGSTAGGIKVIRAAVFMKLIHRGMYRRIHPQSVKPVMIRRRAVTAENASGISCFILLFLAVYLAGVLLLSLENFDLETTLSAPLALLTNTGVGFGRVWTGNFAIFSAPGKLLCAMLLILGRLELYAVLILFSRSFWNSDKARA